MDFLQIRPYGRPASRANAFEELSSILIREDVVAWPAGVTFYRFGNPDGGREGKGVLPNGDVWVWQAKFLFEFTDAAANQVTGSIKRALELEPNLRKYYVALPIDLPAGDTEGKKRKLKSAQTRWEEKQAEWVALAKTKGLDVEFHYIGAHQLVTALTESKHSGRARYWFDAELLSPSQQLQQLNDTVAKVGRRYTPELHVEVEAVRALDALARTETYIGRWQSILASLRKSRGYKWHAPKGDEDAFNEDLGHCIQTLDAADVSLTALIVAARSTGTLPDIKAELKQAQDSLQVVEQILHDRHLKDSRYYVDEAGALYRNISDARDALWAGTDLLRGEETSAAQDGTLLLVGRAGVGKTHLFCDVASKRLDAGRPTIMVLGQDFDSRPLLPQIGELAQIDGQLDDLLKVLDAASETAECIGLLMIDAVNESEKAERWRDELRVLKAAVARYPHVALAVSCRSEFLDPVVGDRYGFPEVEHPGFAEATSEAIQRYMGEYQLEQPALPMLNPEFGNPLFLKLACEALTTLGQSRFSFGSAGLLTVCTAFMEAVNKRLASSSRCDYDDSANLVVEAVRELALTGPGPYERVDVQRITDSVLPGRSWSRSIFLGLLREGVLIQTTGNHIGFGYQRLGDVLRAGVLAEKPIEEVTGWLHGLGTDYWRENGVIGALALIAPERFNTEIVDLLVDKERKTIPGYAIDAFLESLALRAPDHTTNRSAEIVGHLLSHPQWTDRVWDMLVRVACVPGHALNAEWLHENLGNRILPERDLTWSEWLSGSTTGSNETVVTMLLEWAWHPAAEDTELPDDVAGLATLSLGWMLASSDRRVRDRATKALVRVADRAPYGFAAALERFRNCNDPYVLERLAAAACGAVLRTSKCEAIAAIADAVTVLIADEWPTHLLTRDYLRRVSETARGHGWNGPEWRPPYSAQWPVQAPSLEEIETIAGPPDYSYSSIWSSLADMGDFGRYVLQPALENIASEDKDGLRGQAERAIFARTLDLGWTPERFKAVDKGRHGGTDGRVERYGKKYQWIGLYEVLGRIMDHHQIQERWSNDQPADYEFAEQLVYRDIDPSVLVSGRNEIPAAKPWFAPEAATFPAEVLDEYPADLNDIPDPLDLLTVTATDGTQWLSLVLHTNWTQELPPEIAAMRAPNLHAWIQIRGYVVPLADVDALKHWAADKDWEGRWMPENSEVHGRLLGAHPTSPDWDWADGHSEPRGPEAQSLPSELLQCVGSYGGTGTNLDSSGAKEATGYVPSRRLIDLLNLQPGVDFVWADASGPAAQDPSAGRAEPHTFLLRRDLGKKLADVGFACFWTVLVNKRLDDHGHKRPGDDYRWLSASASYVLLDDTIELIDSIATRRSPGPDGEHSNISWNIRPSEA